VIATMSRRRPDSSELDQTGGERTKVKVRDLVKVFGPSPEAAVQLLMAGENADEIRSRTGNTIAINRVSFDITASETFVVMGLSGSGKSTLIRCLNRLLTPTSGTIEIDGQDLLAMSDAELKLFRRKRAAMVFQHFALLPHRTVLENVELGLKIQKLPKVERRERAADVLALVGLSSWERSRPRELSGGMQQRVGLARALATDPDILLMDEPFSALDPLIRRDMQDELVELQRRLRKTIIFITHDIAEALKLGDRVAVMRRGEIVQVASPAELVGLPADDYVANFIRGVDRASIIRLGSIVSVAVRARTSEPLPQPAQAGQVVFVVDDADRPIGVSTANSNAAHGRETAAARDEEFVQLSVAADLRAAFPACACGVPIAVVDEDRRLIGTVRPSDVFAALLDQGAATGGFPHA